MCVEKGGILCKWLDYFMYYKSGGDSSQQDRQTPKSKEQIVSLVIILLRMYLQMFLFIKLKKKIRLFQKIITCFYIITALEFLL